MSRQPSAAVRKFVGSRRFVAAVAVASFVVTSVLCALTTTQRRRGRYDVTTNVTVDVYDVTTPTRKYGRCVRLRTSPSPIVCVHDASVDRYVSAAILAGDIWESDVVRCFQYLLRLDDRLGVVDIGANVGEYTLLAAAMGRHVVAVEARLVHVQMMQRAVVDGRLGALVTLVHNAVSDRRDWAALYARRENPGATKAVPALRPCWKKTHCPPSDQYVRTVTLDDLLAVIPFSRALVKFDIEGDEAKVALQSTRFLRTLYVPYILMEWLFAASAATDDSPLALLAYMRRHGYRPMTVARTRLDWKRWRHWPDNVLWVLASAPL